jgi:hypothetical protein
VEEEVEVYPSEGGRVSVNFCKKLQIGPRRPAAQVDTTPANYVRMMIEARVIRTLPQLHREEIAA